MNEVSENMKNLDFGAFFLRENIEFPLTFARKHIPHPFGADWARLEAVPKLPPGKPVIFVTFREFAEVGSIEALLCPL